MNTGMIVLLDTCILINMFRGECTDILGSLVQYDFRVTSHVVNEITDPEQQSVLRRLIEHGVLSVELVSDNSTIQDIEFYMHRLAAGEASCLAVAKHNNWIVGTDDGLAIRIVEREIASNKVITTPGLLVTAIRYGIVSIEEADSIKELLETDKFRMSFKSFSEIV